MFEAVNACSECKPEQRPDQPSIINLESLPFTEREPFLTSPQRRLFSSSHSPFTPTFMLLPDKSGLLLVFADPESPLIISGKKNNRFSISRVVCAFLFSLHNQKAFHTLLHSLTCSHSLHCLYFIHISVSTLVIVCVNLSVCLLVCLSFCLYLADSLSVCLCICKIRNAFMGI